MSAAKPRLGGVLLRVEGRLLYVPASSALRLAPVPPITRVPGVPEELLGVALHEGDVVPVVAVGPLRESMLVCTHGGALLGIVGGSVVATGMFDAADDGATVRHGDERATPLDVASVCEKTSPASWGGRWLA